MKLSFPIVVLLILTHASSVLKAQATATITEELMSLDTYSFHTPNPVPIVADNPKIPPYSKFEGYSHTAEKRNWKVVTLENDYIKLLVLPEIGGKVWGAIEKSTGEEFLYKNEVIKFRNIAMRGPWTSGGIEFNFGIIGHSPATATAVDYLTRKNADGSVSCIVGNTDLPSNTRWTVEIRLENDKAYFETNASWYNASPLTESYYNWMTAAAVATNDLEFFIPGNAYVEHNGDAHPWPIDEEGRNLAMYKNNTFGPAKSYHIVGAFNDYFGGYYHDRKFGYGQWSPYEEMPGQKLWLWALSRSGGIWEDLLTDTDGQYIEFQAGRLFDQYDPGTINPISQVGFDPYVMDHWSEIWFPFKEIGGMEDASQHGVLNIETDQVETTIGINALQTLNTELVIVQNGKPASETISLRPMEVFIKKIASKPTDKLEVYLEGTELHYTNDSNATTIKRPFYPDTTLVVSKNEALLFKGIEAMEFREFELAHETLTTLVQLDPSNQTAHIELGKLEYRRTNTDKALEHANTVLRMDTYHPGANYLAGITYRAQKDFTNALESLGWAARDIKYRSVAYAQMAELYLAQKNHESARKYANKALAFNTYSSNAREVLLVLERLQSNMNGFKNQKTALAELDPLNHFVAVETASSTNEKNTTDWGKLPTMQNEFPEESTLGIVIKYHSLGMPEAALAHLKGELNPKSKLWKAFLLKEDRPEESKTALTEVVSAPIAFIFPFRRETVAVLEWAVTQNTNWKLKYYLAHNYISVGLKEKGVQILEQLGDTPDTDIFYRFRAKMTAKSAFAALEKDYLKAVDLNPKDWKLKEDVIQFYVNNDKFAEAAKLSTKAYRTYPNNYNIGLAHAKALLNIGKYEKVLEVLKNIQVLPFEHASESREIYERAHVAVALALLQKNKNEKASQILKKSKEWPENIGVGKPYSPDERTQDYLLALAMENMNMTAARTELLKNVVRTTENKRTSNSLNHLFGLLAAKKLNDTRLDELLSKLSESGGEKTSAAIALFQGDATKLTNDTSIPVDVSDLLQWVVTNQN